MSIKTISAILKQERNMLNLTPDQVVSKLSDRGFHISTKALYAYEAGTNLPKVPVFLALCDIYNIHDIMGSFGYTATLCNSKTDWATDQYDDFFKATLYEKIFLLTQWGIPSFDGYDKLLTEPGQIVLSDKELEIIKMYRAITPEAKEVIYHALYGTYQNCGRKLSLLPKKHK